MINSIWRYLWETILDPETTFLEEINRAIEKGELVLPTLPEVALQVQDAMQKNDVALNEISDIIAADSALSARIMKIANSPIYRGRVAISSLPQAVSRLGIKNVRTLVCSFVMQQMFQSTNEGLDHLFREAWESSVQIAAISKVLAQQVSHLDAEQAMLAGLIHNLGVLPIITFSEEQNELMLNSVDLASFAEKHSPEIGTRITESWGFCKSLVDAVSQSGDFYRDHQEKANYADLVIVARLQNAANIDHPLAEIDWNNVPAFRKIGMDPEISIVDIEGVAEQLDEVQELFN
jgi:HD-like signal output (HDOD) protein